MWPYRYCKCTFVPLHVRHSGFSFRLCIFGWLLLFGESTITAANKYSAFGCKSGYKSKGGEQGQNSPFTLIQFMTRICALDGWKLILAKTVPCAVESFTAYTCSSYYRRSIRTSLSSLQSHVVISLWSNSYAIGAVSGSRILYPNFLLDSWKSHFRW